MTEYTYSEELVSDLHKDARGYRPSSYWWEDWRLSGPSTKQTIWNNLSAELDDELARERAMKTKALTAFEARISQAYEHGAKSMKQALKWIFESEEFDEFDYQYGADYVCYHFGLDYSVKEMFPFAQVINEILAKVE